jgi:hypothetical protein
MKTIKTEKSSLFAAVLNFLFWGMGYLYIEKKIEEAFYLISLYLVVCIFSFWYLSIAGPVSFAGFYWIIFWSLWVGIYIGYDAYKIGKVKK